MKVLRDNPAARWFPSRRRFGLGKLIAFVALRRHCARPQLQSAPEGGTSPHSVLAADRDQDAIEIYSVAILRFAVTTCFVASFLPMPAPLAILLAVLLDPLLTLIPCFVIGSLFMPRWTAWRQRGTVNFQSENGAVLMTLAIAASVGLVWRNGWARPVGALFLVLVVINALASIAVRILSTTIARLEERCVA